MLVVDASTSIFKSSFKSLTFSRRFSFFNPFELLVLPGGHTGPSTGNLVGELVADTDDQQALVDPLFLFSIPGGADLLIFKKLDLVATLFLIHDMYLPG